MSVLQSHRERVAACGRALDELQQMHDEAHGLWSRIVEIGENGHLEHREELDRLHDQAFALAARIAALREETFGEMTYDAKLRIASQVESIHPSRLNPQPVQLDIR